MRQKIQSQSDDSFAVLAKQLELKPMAQRPVGFSLRALDPDEESLISDVSRVPGNPTMTKLEVEKCMRERLVKNRDEILKAILSIVFSWPGRVRKKELFDIINGFWIALSREQFETLISDIQEYGDSSIDFRDLFTRIEGKRRLKYGVGLIDKSKYGLPAPTSITVPGLDFVIQAKINSNIKEVTRGLRMHEESNGLIRRDALKKVLDTFVVATKQNQFNNLMKQYDPHNTGFVNVHDFLVQLGIHVHNYAKRNPDRITASSVFNWNEPYFDELEVNTRKNAVKYSKIDPHLLGLPISEIVVKYEDKIGKNLEALTKCFLTYDMASSGLVSQTDFRNVLSYFVYPTSINLYRELMQKLEIKKVGNMIAWEQFLETIKQKVSSGPKQQHPVVHRWNKDPHRAIWTKTTKAEICKCGDLTNLQPPLTLKGIMEKLRKYNIVPGPVTRKIFPVRTNVGERLITRSDFKLFLGRRCCVLSERELNDLMNLLDPDHHNRITYNRFQTLFCENPPRPPTEKEEIVPDKRSGQWCRPRYDLAETAITNMAACFPDLSPEDAIVKLRRHMHKNWDSFSKTILSRSHGRNGQFIYQEELRSILDVMVMQLTDLQWQHLLKQLGLTTGQVNAQYFLDSFAIMDVEALDRWNRTVSRLFGDAQRKTFRHEDELEKKLLDLMEKRGKEIHFDLVEMDSKSFGFVGKKGLRKLMAKFMPELGDEGFEELWSRLPSNEYSNVDYEWFLRKYKHFYSSPPSHRCQCECEYTRRALGGGDHEPPDARLLAGGMQADKKPDKPPVIPEKKTTNDNKHDHAPSTSNPNSEISKNSKSVTSDSSVTTVPEEEGIVHVPFRPPTPPKHPHHKDSSVGPLVLHKNEDRDREHRQSAGMDAKYHPIYTETCEDPYRPTEPAKRRKSSTTSSDGSPKSSGGPVIWSVGSSSRVGSSKSAVTPRTERWVCRCRRPRTVHGVAERGEEGLRRVVEGKWREMRLELNREDGEGTGFVGSEAFRGVLRGFGVDMSVEMDEVLKKYGVPNTGKVDYMKFLQGFVIHLQPEKITVVARRKFQRVPELQLGSPTAGLYDTLMSLKAPILAHFVDLRRVLRSHDKTGRGWIHAIDFRKLLHHFNLSLTDERFFFLMEYFDPNLTGHFHYNEFLRIFTTIK